jgi:hypothetical protein
MKTLKLAALSSTLALLAGVAAAQAGTDAARELAAQATAAQQHQRLSQAPAAEPVAPGDYRAEAHNRSRLAQFHAEQRALRDYAAGLRSQPIAVHSEDSARAEAQRLHAEQALAARAAATQATLAAQ